jgi:hypothetical protein
MDGKIAHYRIHDLRHFFASLLLSQGVELKVVSELFSARQEMVGLFYWGLHDYLLVGSQAAVARSDLRRGFIFPLRDLMFSPSSSAN